MKYLITLFLGLVIVSAQAQTKLELNLTEGETYKQSTLNEASITQELMGQSIEITLGVSSTMSFTVTSANRNDYDMNVTFEKMNLSMGSLQGKMEFDSENPAEDDSFSQIMSGVIGQSFKVKMAKTGKILDISGVEEMWEASFANQNTSAAEKAQIMTQLNQTYGKESIKGNIEMVTAIFPEGKVRNGDQWTNNVNINAGMKGVATTNYTYEGMQGDQHQISGSGTIVTSDEGATINTNGIELTMDLNGTMESAISVDAATGWIVDAKINQKIDGNASMAGNDQMPNGLTIPMKIRNEMTITN